MGNSELLKILKDEAIDFAGAVVNDLPCFVDVTLMKIFDCKVKEEFIKDYVEPTKVLLDRRGEMWENHIFHVHFNNTKKDFFFFSALAVMVMAGNFKNYELYDDLDFAKDMDTSFFINPKNINRRLKVGDKVEVLVMNPDEIFPCTAKIPYLGKIGHIINQQDDGKFHVVISPDIPAVVFSRESLKLIVE